jgi:hypothetical protein
LKHPYPKFLLAVVLPSALAVGATLMAVRSEWSRVQRTSDQRVARMLIQERPGGERRDGGCA